MIQGKYSMGSQSNHDLMPCQINSNQMPKNVDQRNSKSNPEQKKNNLKEYNKNQVLLVQNNMHLEFEIVRTVNEIKQLISLLQYSVKVTSKGKIQVPAKLIKLIRKYKSNIEIIWDKVCKKTFELEKQTKKMFKKRKQYENRYNQRKIQIMQLQEARSKINLTNEKERERLLEYQQTIKNRIETLSQINTKQLKKYLDTVQKYQRYIYSKFEYVLQQKRLIHNFKQFYNPQNFLLNISQAQIKIYSIQLDLYAKELKDFENKLDQYIGIKHKNEKQKQQNSLKSQKQYVQDFHNYVQKCHIYQTPQIKILSKDLTNIQKDNENFQIKKKENQEKFIKLKNAFHLIINQPHESYQMKTQHQNYNAQQHRQMEMKGKLQKNNMNWEYKEYQQISSKLDQLKKEFHQNQKPPKDRLENKVSNPEKGVFSKDLYKSMAQMRKGILSKMKMSQYKLDQKSKSNLEELIVSLITLKSYELKYNIYLPALVKVTLVGINSLNRDNGVASVAIKIQIKIKIPGISNNPQRYRRIFQKLKIKVKTEDTMRQQDITIDFNLEPDKIQKDDKDQPKYKTKIHNNPQKYYSQVYKWAEIDHQQSIQFAKQLYGFQGLICTAQIKDVKTKIKSYDRHSPFEILDLQGIIQILPIETQPKQWNGLILGPEDTNDFIEPQIIIKANFLDIESNDQKDKFMNQITCFQAINIDGYQIAQKLLHLEVGNSMKSKQQLKNGCKKYYWQKTQEKIKDKQGAKQQNKQSIQQYDCYAHYHLVMYKHPSDSLAAIFIPTVVLGVVNLFIFFQDIDLASRIASISTLLISFVGMIAILKQIIKSDTITISSVLVYLMTVTSLICLCQSLYLHFLKQRDSETIPEPLKSPLFWICVAIVALNILYPIAMFVYYKCILQNLYDTDVASTQNYLRQPIMPGDKILENNNKLNFQKNAKKFITISESNWNLQELIQSRLNIEVEKIISKTIYYEKFKQQIELLYPALVVNIYKEAETIQKYFDKQYKQYDLYDDQPQQEQEQEQQQPQQEQQQQQQQQQPQKQKQQINQVDDEQGKMIIGDGQEKEQSSKPRKSVKNSERSSRR